MALLLLIIKLWIEIQTLRQVIAGNRSERLRNERVPFFFSKNQVVQRHIIDRLWQLCLLLLLKGQRLFLRDDRFL